MTDAATPQTDNQAKRTTIDPSEVEKFSRIAAEWWDPNGNFKPLHKFNPTRLTFIKEQICLRFGRDASALAPLKGISILDIGCGGGLVSEPLARLGAEMTSIDASENNIKTAMQHAHEQGVDVNYRCITVEDLADELQGQKFDVVLNLEVVEHVADVDLFLGESANFVGEKGMMFVATINRTVKALLTAKIAAEYILRWLPAGTHDPAKFVSPQTIDHALQQQGLHCDAPIGVGYDIFKDQWKLTDDASVNFMMIGYRD